MQATSKKYIPEAEVGSYVKLHVPGVDRELTYAPYIICRVVDHDY